MTAGIMKNKFVTNGEGPKTATMTQVVPNGEKMVRTANPCNTKMDTTVCGSLAFPCPRTWGGNHQALLSGKARTAAVLDLKPTLEASQPQLKNLWPFHHLQACLHVCGAPLLPLRL